MITEITVEKKNDHIILTADDVNCPAAIGRNGMVDQTLKSEGDGMTPIGIWPVRCLYFRPDRITLPSCALTQIPITPDMGWCDDPEHHDYNKEVRLPFGASHEMMWRDDHAYDVVIPLGYNDDQPIPHNGSAIFFHLLHDGKDVTAGCVAIARDHMISILPKLTTKTVVRIVG